MEHRLPSIADLFGSSHHLPPCSTVAQGPLTSESHQTLDGRLESLREYLSQQPHLGPDPEQRHSFATNFSRWKLFTNYVPNAHQHIRPKKSQSLTSHRYTHTDIGQFLGDLAASWDPNLTVSCCTMSHHLTAESLRTGVASDVEKTGYRLIHSPEDLGGVLLAGSDISNSWRDIRVGYTDSKLTIEWEAPLGTYIPHSDMNNPELPSDEALWLKPRVEGVPITPAPGAWLSLITRAELVLVDTAATRPPFSSYQDPMPGDNMDLYED